MKRVILSLVTVASLAFGSVELFDASTVKVDFTGQIGKGGHVQFFIDADNNPSTGYSRGGSKAVSGADYLIEDGTLFKRKNGVSGWSKAWKKLGHIAFQKSAYNGVMFVPKSKVHLKNGAKFTAYALPKNWANSAVKSLGTAVLHTHSQSVSTDHQSHVSRGSTTKQIFIVGDSTVNYSIDFRPKRQKTVEGWGEELGSVLKDPSHLYNGARYGASVKSYRIMPVPTLDHKRYSRAFGKHRNLTWKQTKKVIQNRAHNGDYLFIQFGSGNDKGMYDAAVDRGYRDFAIDKDYNHNGHINDSDDARIRKALIKQDFKQDIKYYINQARALHLKPVLITSINPRWYRPNGLMRDLRKPFTDYVREVAQEEGVVLLDLHQKSLAEYNKYQCGERGFRETFGECHQMDIDTTHLDVTHLNKKGAKIVAGWVKELACQADNSLCQLFK